MTITLSPIKTLPPLSLRLLSSQLDAATKPSSDLDQAIDAYLHGPRESHCGTCGTHQYRGAACFTSDLKDAMSLLPAHLSVAITGSAANENHHRAWTVNVLAGGWQDSVKQHWYNPALAICTLAMRYRLREPKGNESA